MSMCKRFQSFNRTGSGGCKICSFPKNPIFWHKCHHNFHFTFYIDSEADKPCNYWNIHTLKHWLFYPQHSFQQTEPYWAMIWEPLRPAVSFSCPRQQGSNISCHGKEGPCDYYTWEFWILSFLMTHSVFLSISLSVCLLISWKGRKFHFHGTIRAHMKKFVKSIRFFLVHIFLLDTIH